MLGVDTGHNGECFGLQLVGTVFSVMAKKSFVITEWDSQRNAPLTFFFLHDSKKRSGEENLCVCLDFLCVF